MIGHPHDRALKRYADGDLAGRRRDRLREHLERCHRCRAQVGWHRWLSVTVRDLETPSLRSDLITRVLAARERGERLILPMESSMRPGKGVRRRLAVGAAAALVLSVAVLITWLKADRSPDHAAKSVEECMRRSELQGLVSGMLSIVATACAQEPTTMAHPEAPAIGALETSALREGAWTYELRRHDESGHWVPQRVEQHELRRVSSGAWRSVTTWRAAVRGESASHVDTVYFAPDGFRPTRQTAFYARGARSGQAARLAFGDDSIVGFLGLEPARRLVRLRLPGDRYPLLPFYHGASMTHLARLLPLRAGWSGALHLAPVGPDFGLRTVALKVSGEETRTVPAGAYECWVLEGSELTGAMTRWWVSKEERLLVRVLGPQGTLEWVLRSHEAYADQARGMRR